MGVRGHAGYIRAHPKAVYVGYQRRMRIGRRACHGIGDGVYASDTSMRGHCRERIARREAEIVRDEESG